MYSTKTSFFLDQLIINRAIGSTKCNRKGIADIRSGQKSITNGLTNEQMSNTSGQTGTLNEKASITCE